ncbi:MAG: peptide ABC transporter substrate-binding protein [Patescibacteria group bacterium]|nr:peptide ABC transporter substrate-binding protein [Patescibacteria group bacterium]
MFLKKIIQALTKNEKVVIFIAIGIFFISGILWLGNFFNKNTVAVPVGSSKYTEGIVGQPKFINPVISNTDTDRDLSQLIYADLTDLIDHYTVSNDGKTWDVFLKDGLLWSDNKPLNSDDVVFTVETIQDPEANSPLFSTWQGIVVSRISELELEFNLRNPYSFFLSNLKNLEIIPKHIFSTIPSANLKLSNYNLEPISSGPYKYVNYALRRDGFITEYNFETNPNYAGKKPFINQISIKFFQGTNELIDAFNSRNIDGFGNLNPKDIDKIKISNKITELRMPRYYAIFFNQNSNDALKDISVREALNLATDKNKLVSEIFNGKADVVNQPIMPSVEGYDGQIGSEQFSLDAASTLLDKGGWLINSSTGIREKKIGKSVVTLDLQMIVPQIQFLSDAADIIQNDWQKIGVKLSLIKLDPNDITQEIIKTRNYQMLMFGNILGNDPDIFSFWHSSERFYPGLNLALFQDNKADTLIETIRQESDAGKRLGEIEDLQKEIDSQKPAVFLFSPYYLYVSVKNLSGLDNKTLVTPSDRFKNISEWYLQTTRVFK